MLSQKIEKTLNSQIRVEAESSQLYLSMACWAERQGFEGVSEFMYEQSEEEREHMLKLIKYLNIRGGKTVVSDLKEPDQEFGNIKKLFERLLDHEIYVSEKINELVHTTFEEKDFATHNFLQWYVEEQIEEEAVARGILDKMNLIGDNDGALYLFDNEIRSIREKEIKKEI